jgi:hypothetical protein
VIAELWLGLYGVRVHITAPAELLDDIRGRLAYAPEVLPDQEAAAAIESSARVGLHMDVASLAGGKYLLSRDREELLRTTAAEAIDYLETQVRQQVSMRSPEKVFMHAGVVGFRDRAVVVPGLSHSGKTTIVAALLRSGASYLSDEYAVLDTEGLVHPFAKPLSIRSANGEPRNFPVETLGGTAAESPLPVGLVVLSTYREGAVWRPSRLSEGDALLKLLRHTAQTRERPADSLAALKRVIEGAVVLSGERGEASEVAPVLLDALTALG